MKKIILSVMLGAFAVAVQAGDDAASCPAAKSACCASEVKAQSQCSAGAKVATSTKAEPRTKVSTTTTAQTAGCCKTGAKVVAKQSKPLNSPKFASK